MAAYLKTLHRRELPIQGNGFCFIGAIVECLRIDYQEDETVEAVLHKIMNQVIDNPDDYDTFHVGEQDVITEALSFLENKLYTEDIMDVVVGITADALKVRRWPLIIWMGLRNDIKNAVKSQFLQD